MTPEQVVTAFYEAFQRKDYAAMQQLYADHATFGDPAFTHLNAAEVRAMWEMLIRRSNDLELTFSDVQAKGNEVQARWVATYTFTTTGKKVVNRIQAHFVCEQGKIVSHRDHFDFYRWASQALGLTGLLLGWTPFLKKKVQQTAAKSLSSFMRKG